ncbi:hypothetical protein FKV23_02525 [Lysobacter alkalisoli]|uniref:Uncharacterized protein n=2 Tax=Marilutibacter alkalisoli TaxID=2591633 RepID=A0A514BP02_9GAMM|nr:hypothetical protein FKV23_02525 [Lysobacter alkalisoli]
MTLGVALPVVIIAGYQDAMTARVVDLRHWLIPLAAGLVACCGYLAGAYAMLGGRRYAWMVLTLPGFFLFSDASGFGMLAVQAMVLAVLATLVAVAFKPDLGEPPRRLPAVLATAVPVQFGAFTVLVLLSFGVEMVWIAQGSHPNNIPVPLPGGTKEAQMAKGQDLLLKGLAGSRHPEAPLWREQIALSETFEYGRSWTYAPARHEMSNLSALGASTRFGDAEKQVQWTFSHDRMRFVGVGVVDRQPKGELGIGANHAAFPSPALTDGERLIVNVDASYQYDKESGRIYQRTQLPPGEVISGFPDMIGETMAILSSRALYLYDARAVTEGFDLLQPRFRIPTPGAIGDLSRITQIELLDGYLISFVYEYNAHLATGGVPFQQIVRVDGDGQVELIARRTIKYDHPPLYRYRTWWLSPLVDTVWRKATGWFAPPMPLAEMDTPPVPRSMWLLAGVLMLLSLLAAIWRTARIGLSPAARWAWVVACGALSLPALAALWLIYPVREQWQDAPLAQPAHA